MKESQNIEFKPSWRDEYLKWICGFANADGGILCIGKDDRGKVIGLQDAGKLLEDIPNKVRDILGIIVDVNLRSSSHGDYLEIVVDSYPYPISYKGEYHYRSGSTKQELKGAALDRFLLRKQGRHWDGVPVPRIGKKDLSKSALRFFREKAAKSGRTAEVVLRENDSVLLEQLLLTEDSYLKRASVLLFHDDPEKFITGAYIKIGFFKSDDDLRYQDEVHGNLFSQVEKTLELLYTKYLKAYISYQHIQRVEEFLFPEGALREALLNALVHKDYSSGAPIQISVYDDHLVLWNSGTLPDNWTIDKLLTKHPSKPFNPLLANAFFRAGYIEAWGRGIEKIARECRELGIDPPHYDYSMSGLQLIFKANPEHLRKWGVLPASEGRNKSKMPVETLVETPVEMSVKTPDRIIAVLRVNPSMTFAQIAVAIGKSLSAVERAAAKLEKNGYLRHIGPRKAGHWEVLK
jgi:ATP-dependent DNA helicase RecG